MADDSLAMQFSNSMDSVETGRFGDDSSQEMYEIIGKNDEAERLNESNDTRLSSLETMQSSITSTSSLRQALYQLHKRSELQMYDSLSNGECFQKPKFDFQEF